MKVLLLQPPVQDFYETRIRQEPLGLSYLAAVLTQAGYQVSLLDSMASNQKRTVKFPDKLCYLNEFYPTTDLSPFKIFSNYYHSQIFYHVLFF